MTVVQKNDLMVIGSVRYVAKHERAMDVLQRTFPEKVNMAMYKVCGMYKESLLCGAVSRLCTTNGYVYHSRCYTASLVIQLRRAGWS